MSGAFVDAFVDADDDADAEICRRLAARALASGPVVEMLFWRELGEDALGGLVVPEAGGGTDVEPDGVAGKPGLTEGDQLRAFRRRPAG